MELFLQVGLFCEMGSMQGARRIPKLPLEMIRHFWLLFAIIARLELPSYTNNKCSVHPRVFTGAYPPVRHFLMFTIN